MSEVSAGKVTKPSPDSRLPVIVLTGFLGAGKTTLLLRWLRDSPMTGKRMGVVMNEFGAESVDSQIIDRPGLPMRQVAGGCVCCAPSGDLERACNQLIASGECDYIVLETSGLADPDSVVDLLTDHDLLTRVYLQGVVTVLDAQWYAHPGEEAGERVLARKQLQFAQVICLSRCDRIADVDIAQVETAVHEINPRARVVRLPFGLPEIADLLAGPPASCEIALNETKANENSEADQSTFHLHALFQSLTFRFPVAVERAKFEAFLTGLNPREVVRAKGFIRFRHAPEKLYIFQSVWGHHLIEEFPALPHPTPVAVFIGPNLEIGKYQLALRKLCFDRPAASLTPLVATPQ